MEKITLNEIDRVLTAHEYVILDFSSPGCAPCKKVPPLIEGVIQELKEPAETRIGAFEVDVAEEPGLAQKYFVLGVPTIIIFHNGQEIQRFNAVPKKEKLIKAIGGR